jgi:protocatechuate 3,4-dioxygenase alpha subunit
MSLQTTASQTVGPYLHIGLTWLVTDNLVGPGVSGEEISIEGRVLDGDGKPVSDALVEIRGQRAWKICASRRPAGQTLETGFGLRPRSHRRQGKLQVHHDQAGGRGAGRRTSGAAHQRDDLHARSPGSSIRIYFPAILPTRTTRSAKRAATRRGTLIANSIAGQPGALEWNVIVQGDGETVFFAC